MKAEILKILVNLKAGVISETDAQKLLLGLFGVSGSAIADLNHIVVNSAMNIMGLTDNEQKVQEECSKIIDAVRVFSKHYR